MLLDDAAGPSVFHPSYRPCRVGRLLDQSLDFISDKSAFLKSVFAASGDCIKILDLDGKLIFMTDVAKRIMEVTDFDAIKGCFWPDLWEGQGNLDARAAIE